MNKTTIAFLSKEALASVVVFLVALPLCLGIAVASGVPPAMGLVSGMIGGLLVGGLSGSPLQVSGPAAGLAVIVAQTVQSHGFGGLALMVMIAGLLQIAAGVLHMGRWFRAISPAVIFGMLSGIGILIAASQFHVMVDDKPYGHGIRDLLSIPAAIYKGAVPVAGSVHHQAAGIGLLTLTILLVWDRFRPKVLHAIPAALVAVIGGTAAAAALDLGIGFVSVPENLLDSLTLPTLELFKHLSDSSVWIGGLGMGFVASAESLLCANALDQMHSGSRTNYNKEMWAQGVGNFVAGVLGVLPVTGVIVRSTANIESGARTRLSTMLHGVWLLLLVVTLPGVLRLVPTASLAAVLVYAGYKLMNFQRIRELARHEHGEVAVFVVTVVSIVSTDLLKGVLIGVAAAAAKLMWHASHLSVDVKTDEGGQRVDIEVSGAATFLRLPKLAKVLESIPEGAEAHVHLRVTHLDHACLELVTQWERTRQERGSETIVYLLPIELAQRDRQHLARSTINIKGHELTAPATATPNLNDRSQVEPRP